MIIIIYQYRKVAYIKEYHCNCIYLTLRKTPIKHVLYQLLIVKIVHAVRKTKKFIVSF